MTIPSVIRWMCLVSVLPVACSDESAREPPLSGAGAAAQTSGSGGGTMLPTAAVGGMTPVATGGSSAGRAAAGASAAGSPAGRPAAGASAAGAPAAGSQGVQAGIGGVPAAGANAGAPALGDSQAALDALKAWLAGARAARPELASQPFAKQPLSRAAAEEARKLLWDDYATEVRETRAGEMGATQSRAATVQVGGKSLRYYLSEHGDASKAGRSLFISMHGGGNAPAATNDQQWNNQIALGQQYRPVDALWVAPRAPSNDWNMWFTPDVDALFERLITNMIVFEGVDPNKIYINGYSAGGDGVYQLGPRMADHWAGAAMSAGHPNASSPLNLYHVPFAIHVGGNDTAYDRNLKAEEWGKRLEQLRMEHPDGYVNQWKVHAGKPHWMDLADQVAIPFVQMYTRNPVPANLVWEQIEVPHSRFYWLAVDAANAKKGTLVRASYTKGAVDFKEVRDVAKIIVRVSDAMTDLDQPVRITRAGAELFAGTISRTIDVIARTLRERGDPALMFDGEVSVEL